MTPEAIFDAALALPPDSQLKLAETLLASLQPPLPLKYGEEWKHEMEGRIAAYRRGVRYSPENGDAAP
jgi:putative addiction module component (TIGR02574 family)